MPERVPPVAVCFGELFDGLGGWSLAPRLREGSLSLGQRSLIAVKYDRRSHPFLVGKGLTSSYLRVG